jgi:hypothetical protein
VADDRIDAYEAALRRLPEAHSLALRLKRAGVADDVIRSYLHIEPEGLETLLRVALDKFMLNSASDADATRFYQRRPLDWNWLQCRHRHLFRRSTPPCMAQQEFDYVAVP